MNNGMVFGLGMYGSAGLGVDYRGNPGLFEGDSNLPLLKFAPAIAGSKDNWGWGFAPVLQYGALDINYVSGDPTQPMMIGEGDAAGPNPLYGPGNVGSGTSIDYGFGFNLGAYMDVRPDLTLGFTYQSAIDMTYDNQITGAAGGFGLTQFTDDLEQPAELKIGAAYTRGSMLYTADVKQIQYGSAKGYKDFNWDDQTVFAVGAKYSADKYWWGVGLNYGKDPIETKSTGASDYVGQAVDLFNNHFFPAVVETHVTFGGGYQLSKTMMLEGAFVYADEVEKTIDTTAVSQGMTSSHTVTHSQTGVTIGLRMNF